MISKITQSSFRMNLAHAFFLTLLLFHLWLKTASRTGCKYFANCQISKFMLFLKC